MKRRRLLLGVAVFGAALFLLLIPAGVWADGGSPSGGLSVLDDIADAILRELPGKFTKDQLLKGAVRGLFETIGDPYADYLDKTEYHRFQEEMQGEYGGIGVVVESREGFVTIMTVFPSSPAQRAGLQPGDRIISVDGRSLEGMTVGDVAALIRGEAGTGVNLSVYRPVEERRFDVRLERQAIELPSVDTRYLEGGLGYIKLSGFAANTGEEFRYIYRRLVGIGAKGIILDLRDNPGGFLDQAVEVAQVLVPRGPLVHIVDGGGGKVTIDAIPQPPGPPLVVLVNAGSASASEIVAGAVQDNGAGVIVGARTFGKGSVQSVVSLPGGGALKLTTHRYLTPRGRSLEGEGITPDVVVQDGVVVLPEFEPLDSRPVRRGARGRSVLGLQQRLKYLGYDPGPADGAFGTRTAAAVRAFRQANGITEGNPSEAGTATLTTLERLVQERFRRQKQAAGDPGLWRAIEVVESRIRSGSADGVPLPGPP